MPVTTVLSWLNLTSSCPFENSRFACGFMPLTALWSRLGLRGDCPYEVSSFAISNGAIRWIDSVLFVPVVVSWIWLAYATYRRTVISVKSQKAAKPDA
jgi:hypothetical protein